MDVFQNLYHNKVESGQEVSSASIQHGQKTGLEDDLPDILVDDADTLPWQTSDIEVRSEWYIKKKFGSQLNWMQGSGNKKKRFIFMY